MLRVRDRIIHRFTVPWIIAEAGVNHDGDLEKAFRLVEMAARAGADAVKFQMFRTADLVTQSAPQATYQAINSGRSESQYAMLSRLELPFNHMAMLIDYAHTLSLTVGITPFDDESLHRVENSDADFIKVGSGDANNDPFLERVARAGKPVILSTGMATAEEVLRADRLLSDCDHALLHCVSSYPTPEEEVNIRSIDWMKSELDGAIGFSDHTLGSRAALMALAAGATIFEKHITLDRHGTGPDHFCSLEEPEFTRYTRELHESWRLLGHPGKAPARCELETRRVARKSLTTRQPLRAGHTLTRKDIVLKRPGDGIPPPELEAVLGQTLNRDLAADTTITPEMLSPHSHQAEPQQLHRVECS